MGKVLAGEVGLFTGRDPDTVRGAGVAFIWHERLAQVASDSFLDMAPELIVEVVSPANTWQEMRQQLDEYFGVGVEVAWIVEPGCRQVLVYPAPDELTALHADDTLEGEGRLDGFALPLAELFG